MLSCGLAVCGSPDDHIRGYVGVNGDPLVSVSGFRKAVKRESLNTTPNVRLASDTIKLAWSSDKKVQTELLEALTILFVTYPVLGSQR